MNGLVRKPWGREYCAFRNSDVAVWVLEIEKGKATSLHAHPRKSTAFVVLRGSIAKHLLRGAPIVLNAMDKINVFRGRFHRQVALTDGVVLLEIESPDDKRDIVRLEDDYGRAGLPIEEPTEPLPEDALQLTMELSARQHFAGCVLQVCNYIHRPTPDSVFVTLRGGLTRGLVPTGEAIDGASLERVSNFFPASSEALFLRIHRDD